MNLPATAGRFFASNLVFGGPQHGTMGKQPVKTVVVTQPSSNLGHGIFAGSWVHDCLRLALFKSQVKKGLGTPESDWATATFAQTL